MTATTAPMTREEMEERRLRAVSMFAAGHSQRTIALALEVSSMSVSRWHDALEKGGPAALKRRAAPGRPPRLDWELLADDIRAMYEAADRKGKTAEGFAALIEARFGVRYDPDHVYRVLRSLGLKERKQVRRGPRLPGSVRREVRYA